MFINLFQWLVSVCSDTCNGCTGSATNCDACAAGHSPEVEGCDFTSGCACIGNIIHTKSYTISFTLLNKDF